MAALRELLAHARYELIPLPNAGTKAEFLPPGAAVSVTASPAHGMEATLTLAEWLQRRQFEAMPHFSARLIRDRAHLTELLERAREAGITRAFVVGGDPGAAEGLRDGLTLLRAMREIGHPFSAIGVPAYPEGHPAIPDDVLLRALQEKAPYAQSMTTQMSFDVPALSAWITRTRTAGISLPLYVGLPGAIALSKLIAVGARIGVAGAARYAAKNRQLLRALLVPGAFTPEPLLRELAPAIAAPEAAIAGLHLFTFNQVEETVAWVQHMQQQLG